MASNFPLQPAFRYESHDVNYLPVTAAQTFIAGTLVKLTSFALVTNTDTTTSTIIGMAMASAADGLATGGSIWGGTNIPVLVMRPGQRYFIASATTPAIGTHLGVLYGVTMGSGTVNTLLDINNTTQVPFRVVGVSNTPQQEGFIVTPNASYFQFCGILS